jgi:hypothetical protein
MPAPPGALTTPSGRLFFTPEERAGMDKSRGQRVVRKQEASAPTLTLNGVVLRSSGKRTVFVNQSTLTERSPFDANLQVRPGGAGTTTIGSGRAPGAKVGETLNRTTGEVASPLGDGHITVKPGR